MPNKKEKTTQIKAERPGGFQDFLPADFLAREKMINIVTGVFRSFGFDQIETPRIEFLKTLAGEESETGKNIFHIKSDTDGEVLALPFDHTVPFARLLAANPYDAKSRSGIRLPWRRMVVGPVFRGEKPQAGRFRQFYQIDADIAGTASMIADTEIIAMMNQTLSELGVKKFQIRLNNRKILNGLSVLLGISDDEKAMTETIRVMDKVDKIGINGVLKELEKNVNSKAIGKVKEYLEIKGENDEKLKEAKILFKGVELAEEGIEELEEILSNLKSFKISKENVAIDFSIARGLDYYTGPVFETVLLDAPKFGSVFSGGRYDRLMERFTGEKLPAVGTSIGFDRMFAALDHLGLLERVEQTVTEVMILRLAKDRDQEYLEMADEVRQSGMRTEVCLLSDTTFKSQFNFALTRGVKYVVICGEDEFESGKVSVKDLEKREQVEIERGALREYFKV